MDNEDITKRIVKILSMTFETIDKCYAKNNEKEKKANYSKAGSRLLFPKRRDKQDKNGTLEEGECRISEQELRFAFIEQFNAYCNKEENKGWEAYYSVETPTENCYRFSSKEETEFPHVCKKDYNNDYEKGGQSAMIDVSIHGEKGKRICLIEFKAGKPDAFSYIKDFLKLSVESKTYEIPCFFIHLMAPEDGQKDYDISSRINQSISSRHENKYTKEFIDYIKETGSSVFYSRHVIDTNCNSEDYSADNIDLQLINQIIN